MIKEEGFKIANSGENARQIEKLRKKIDAILDLFTYTLTEKAEDHENMRGSVPSWWPQCPKCNQEYYKSCFSFGPKILLCTKCNTHFIGDKII